MLMCDAVLLLKEVDRIYKDHYANSGIKAIHDFHSAVTRRIRRYTMNRKPEIITARFKRNPNDYSEWVLSMIVNLDYRNYQVMIRLPKEIYDTKCTDVEVNL